MKIIKVKAIFRGQDNSCGYRTNSEYTLDINQGNNSFWIENSNTYEHRDGSGYCEYGSVISFLENWDNIRRI